MQCCGVFAEKTLPLWRQRAHHSPWIHSDMTKYPYYVCPAEYHHGWCGSHHTTAADAVAYRDLMERESGFEWRIIHQFIPKQEL